jgi:hypothetical protein
LNAGELDAVVKMFDKKGNGLIGCNDFLFALNTWQMAQRSDKVRFWWIATGPVIVIG